MVLGAVLRAITFFAYRPALIFWDSTRYLEAARALKPGKVRPIGYSIFLRLLPIENELAVVPFVQHLMGLGMALLIYVLLLRLGAKRWVAAVATIPVLFDAYQLNLEQQVLTETLFQALLLVGLALLLWRRRPNVILAGAAGLAFAASFMVRTNALLVIGPALLVLLLLRPGIKPVFALLAGFFVPMLGYMLWFHSWYGTYAINSYAGNFMYPRVAVIADCSKLSLPRYERVLCPAEPLGERLSHSRYMWGDNSPRYDVVAPPGMTREQVVRDFSKRVIKAQPFAYMRSILVDFMRGFAPARETLPGEAVGKRGGTRAEFWRFKPKYPLYRSKTRAVVRAHGGNRPVAEPSLARFLVAYQRVANTPGPLLFGALLAALMAALGIGRARSSGLRTAAFAFAVVAVTVLLAASVHTFSWRYQLPQLVLLPPAAAIAFTAFTGSRSPAQR